MIWLALLLTGAVISGNDAYMEQLEVDALQHDVLAKGMLLQTFSLFLQRMYDKQPNAKGEDEVKGIIRKEPEDHTEVISAIYDRYVGFKLVINFYACVLFYEVGAAAPENGESEGCLEYARYVHWFNGQFTAEEFYAKLKISGAAGAKYNLKEVVEKLGSLFEKQKEMVKAFETAGQDENNPYKDVFKLLRQPSEDVAPLPHLDESYATPLETSEVQRGEVEDKFRQDSLERLYLYFGEDLYYVETYFNLFFSQAAERPLVDHPQQMVRDALFEEEAQRSHFKAAEESNLDAAIHDFQNAHEVQYVGLLYTGLEMRARNVDRVLSPKDWEIAPAQEGSLVDFLFRFTKDPPKKGGKGKATESPREGGEPSTGDDDFRTLFTSAGGAAIGGTSSTDVGTDVA